MKRAACVVFAALWAIAPLLAEEPATPELVASLFPAGGYIPVGSSDHPVYRFQVMAQEVDEAGKVKMKGDAIMAKAMADTLVEPGQTRAIASPQANEWRLDGTVTIRKDGFVTYHVSLLHKGERLSSTSAGMNLKNGQ